MIMTVFVTTVRELQIWKAFYQRKKMNGYTKEFQQLEERYSI